MTDTEVVDNASELVELYNPAEVFASFAEAAREAAGFQPEPTATDDLLATAGVAPEETFTLGAEDAYAGAADSWAAGQPAVLDADARRAPRSRCTTSRSTTRSAASRARPACSTSSRRRPRG